MDRNVQFGRSVQKASSTCTAQKQKKCVFIINIIEKLNFKHTFWRPFQIGASDDRLGHLAVTPTLIIAVRDDVAGGRETGYEQSRKEP